MVVLGVVTEVRHLTTIFRPSSETLILKFGRWLWSDRSWSAKDQSLGALHYVRFDEVLDVQAIPITVDEVPVLLLATRRPRAQGSGFLDLTEFKPHIRKTGTSKTPQTLTFSIPK